MEVNKILIDTNIYSHAMRGTATVVAELQRASEIGICAISIGELLSGFKGGSRERENRDKLKEFLDSPRVRLFLIDEITSEFYAEILDQLKKAGRPVPTNDLWISAVALQNGLKLYTMDQHFQYVPGLILIA